MVGNLNKKWRMSKKQWKGIKVVRSAQHVMVNQSKHSAYRVWELTCKILLIKFFECSHMLCCESGNANEFANIFSYVVLMSFESNCGFPTSKVYMITPVDQISTSKLWPFVPCKISGAEWIINDKFNDEFGVDLICDGTEVRSTYLLKWDNNTKLSNKQKASIQTEVIEVYNWIKTYNVIRIYQKN